MSVTKKNNNTKQRGKVYEEIVLILCLCVCCACSQKTEESNKGSKNMLCERIDIGERAEIYVGSMDGSVTAYSHHITRYFDDIEITEEELNTLAESFRMVDERRFPSDEYPGMTYVGLVDYDDDARIIMRGWDIPDFSMFEKDKIKDLLPEYQGDTNLDLRELEEYLTYKGYSCKTSAKN